MRQYMRNDLLSFLFLKPKKCSNGLALYAKMYVNVYAKMYVNNMYANMYVDMCAELLCA